MCRYKFIKQIGSGEDGWVDLVQNPQGKLVALKQGMRVTLEEEGVLLQYIQDHGPIAGVPRLLDILPDGSLVLEYIDGYSPCQIKPKTQSWVVIQDYITQLLEIMGQIHWIGVSHGDIHDRNLLVARGKLYLIDFGWAFRIYGEEPQTFPYHSDLCDLLWTVERWTHLVRKEDERVSHQVHAWADQLLEEIPHPAHRISTAKDLQTCWKKFLQSQIFTRMGRHG